MSKVPLQCSNARWCVGSGDRGGWEQHGICDKKLGCTNLNAADEGLKFSEATIPFVVVYVEFINFLFPPSPPQAWDGSHIKRGLNQNLSGNEVNYTACSLLVTLNNLCSKLHRQNFFDLIPLSCKIVLE